VGFSFPFSPFLLKEFFVCPTIIKPILAHLATFFLKEDALILMHYTGPFKKELQIKEKLQKSTKLLFIFLEDFRDPFITAAKATSQSSSGTRANLHKVEAAEESLLLRESAEYTTSQAHRPTSISMTHPLIPPLATRAKLRFSPKIIFLKINRVNNIIT
jgi:hypothetical protein